MKKLQMEIMALPRGEIVELQRWLSTYLTFVTTNAFDIGDKVFFYSKKHGRINGTVSRINSKTISVDNTVSETTGKKWRGWRVCPTMLEKD